MKNKKPFRVGQLVTTKKDRAYDYEIVRKVTEVIKSNKSYTGFLVSADAGETCPHCGQYLANPIGLIHADWFQKFPNG